MQKNTHGNSCRFLLNCTQNGRSQCYLFSKAAYDVTLLFVGVPLNRDTLQTRIVRGSGHGSVNLRRIFGTERQRRRQMMEGLSSTRKSDPVLVFLWAFWPVKKLCSHRFQVRDGTPHVPACAQNFTWRAVVFLTSASMNPMVKFLPSGQKTTAISQREPSKDCGDNSRHLYFIGPTGGSRGFRHVIRSYRTCEPIWFQGYKKEQVPQIKFLDKNVTFILASQVQVTFSLEVCKTMEKHHRTHFLE